MRESSRGETPRSSISSTPTVGRLKNPIMFMAKWFGSVASQILPHSAQSINSSVVSKPGQVHQNSRELRMNWVNVDGALD